MLSDRRRAMLSTVRLGHGVGHQTSGEHPYDLLGEAPKQHARIPARIACPPIVYFKGVLVFLLIFWMIVLGLIVGWIARLITPGEQ
jgi:hypothetical protein